jgi:hypothetical protein
MSDDPSLLDGGCLCGDIRYRISGAPIFVSQCFCRDCQKATGTGHTTIVGVAATHFRVTRGTPTVYTCAGDTGGKVHRHFCARCGGRLFTTGDLPGEIRIVQAGSLDFPERVTPTSAIYLKDRIAWDLVDPALTAFQAMRDRRPEP